MRLTSIREQTAGDANGTNNPGVPIPTTAGEADELFHKGMRRIDAGRDGEAFEIFKSLAQFKDWPPELLTAAETCRDVLDPATSPGEKAKRLMSFFRTRLNRIKLGDWDTLAEVEHQPNEDHELD